MWWQQDETRGVTDTFHLLIYTFMKTNEVLGHAAAQWPSQLTEPSPIDHAYHPPK